MKVDVAAKYDVVIIGSGISGLICALELSQRNKSVCLITKEAITESSSLYAQGGISIPLSESDSFERHLEDTLNAGSNLCDVNIAKEVIRHSVNAFQKLVSYGVKFDLTSENIIHQTKEAAHSVPRVIHVGGDASGRIITKTLIDRVCREPHISISQGACVLSLLKESDRVCGVLVEDVARSKYVVLAKHVIVASGGLGRIYKYTTNPSVSTGDGIAMSYRAGAVIQDIEMIQFHPTVLLEKGDPRLITEAIRGEGGKLKNINGEYFASKYHPQAELAPRDVLARALLSEMEKTNSGFVYLDVSSFKKEYFINRFPTVYKECIERNIDVFGVGIPVSPAAHYLIGGIKSDIYGSTNIPSLWVVGEAASNGFHGANRLASNSLLECIVVPHLLVEKLMMDSNFHLPSSNTFNVDFDPENFTDVELLSFISELQERNTKSIFLVRNELVLNENLIWLRDLMSKVNLDLISSNIQLQELKNMILLSFLMTQASILRKHSLGVHYREDYKNLPTEFIHSIFKKDEDIKWQIQKNKPEFVSVLK